MNDDQEDKIDQLIAEFLSKVDEGEDISAEEFAAHYPEQEELLDLLQMAAKVEDMAGPIEETVDFTETINSSAREGHTDLLPGDTIGNYKLLRELGRGGMGAVFVARQSNPNREVAFKTILAGTKASLEDIERFYTEAKLAGSIGHPNIVTIIEAGEVDGHHYMTMELVNGYELSHYSKQRELTDNEIAELMVRTADAVQAAHEAGIVHRDLKPSNILIDESGVPKITDFGLAKLESEDRDLTKTNCALGTPSYMPPEQATGKHDDVSPRSDVYSLGAVMYMLLTGRPPHIGETSIEIILKVLQDPIRRPRELNPSACRDLEAIAWKCLESDPKYRYASAAELRQDLARYLDGEPINAAPSTSRRIRFWCSNLPGLGHAFGNARPHPKWHHWFACAVLVLLLASPFISRAYRNYRISSTLPARVKIFTAQPHGSFVLTGNTLNEIINEHTQTEVEIVNTEGSIENIQCLRDNPTSPNFTPLAFVQQELLVHNDIKPVLPLFNEGVYVIARKDLNAKSIKDLKEPIALGTTGSGNYLTAKRMLKRLEVKSIAVDSPNNQVGVAVLANDKSYQGAIVVVASNHLPLELLLEKGEHELIALTADEIRLLDEDRLFDTKITQAESKVVAASGLSSYTTVFTTTYLAMRNDGHPQMIKNVVQLIVDHADRFQDPKLFDLSGMRDRVENPPILHEIAKETLREIAKEDSAKSEAEED